ncbi:sugar ABC transporter substrate-binding protein [Paenibacillus woosongensis]|uniref:Sugar ABC transporter substrate-binding protein n=1 Tax=Paenibacillus woosongensis TaxID=307580 RepID=A0AA95L3A1_9BACL|nr:sugar ABC transporter substrate-binding protein [Paenibacillus woosongensis]WHX51222.1 sugar ABC transporter substrate-binding protein [Paenibacillus woosongensis]
MKSQHKKWGALLLAITLLSALLISGCSTKGKGGGDVELKLGFYSSAQSDEKMQELIAKFQEKHPNIKIKTESSPYNQFFQKLDTQIAAESAPDVWLSDGVLVPKYAERGVLKDLTEWIQRDLKAGDYYGLEFNKDAAGKYWGVPQGIQIAVLYYNKDMFDEAQIEYPTDAWSWDDLKTAAEKLTKDTNGKYAVDPAFDKNKISQYGLTFFSITEGWMTVLKSYGGGVLNETLEQSIIDSPENKAALDWIVDGMQRELLPTPSDLKSFQSNMAPFPSKAAAMRIGIYARTIDANAAGLNYDVTLLPKGPEGKRFSPVIANSWVINKKAEGAVGEAAWEWVKFWATEDEVQKEWASLGEAVPVKKSVANSEQFLSGSPANKQAFLDSFEFAGTLDVNAVWSEWVGKFNDSINRAFEGEISVEQAMKQADQEVQKVLDEFYKK